LNIIGLRRRGFNKDTINTLKKAYSYIFSTKYNVSDAVKKIKEEIEVSPEIQALLEFIDSSDRGIIR